MDKPLKVIVKERMNELGLTNRDLAKQTGIPEGRIYKWYADKKTANPKEADSETLRKWLKSSSKKSEQVTTDKAREELGPSYLRQRWLDKVASEDYFVPFIPFQARAGYSRNYENVDYLHEEFEMYQLPPGINPRGAEWRWFEVGGDSMSPLLEENDVLLCSLVPVADWQDLEQFKIYVVVWKDMVSVKRVAIDKGDFILISENEASKDPQRRISSTDIKEVWKLRRQLNARFPPTKRFKITV